MDISTPLGLFGGIVVVSTLILMGGSFGMYVSDHAMIIIFGGSFSATLIHFPLSSIFPTVCRSARNSPSPCGV